MNLVPRVGVEPTTFPLGGGLGHKQQETNRNI